MDGIDLRDLDARSWQRQVAVVNQDFGRYPLTARENIAFRDLTADGVSGDLDQAALERAAAQAGALEFIRALPHGWDTICAPGYRDGTDLSGGQWQRIALARALYAAGRGAGSWSSTSRRPSWTSGPRRRSTTGSWSLPRA